MNYAEVILVYDGKGIILKEYIKNNWEKSFNEPVGNLKYKFLDPAANYRGQLWDWDSFFCGIALESVFDKTADYIKGCVMNFVANQASDGSIPYMINSGETREGFILPSPNPEPRASDSELNSMKPLLAQMIMIVYEKSNDKKWINEMYSAVARHIEHWENTQMVRNGLFVWRSHRGSGTDNHPAVYGRPLNSCAATELNSFMYSEYRSAAKIAGICADESGKKMYKEKADNLKDAINKHMWDEVDSLYYNLDMLSAKPDCTNQDITWDVPLKFRAWTCFAPMYAEIAPKDYAEAMVKSHLINSNEFWSDFGIRTLAKNERAYTTIEINNPSNWQGLFGWYHHI